MSASFVSFVNWFIHFLIWACAYWQLAHDYFIFVVYLFVIYYSFLEWKRKHNEINEVRWLDLFQLYSFMDEDVFLHTLRYLINRKQICFYRSFSRRILVLGATHDPLDGQNESKMAIQSVTSQNKENLKVKIIGTTFEMVWWPLKKPKLG